MVSRVSGILAACVLMALPASAGCSKKSGKPPRPKLTAAAYVDVTNNGVVDDGDIITVTFDKPVTLGATDPSTFALPVTGDTFGTTATVGQIAPGTPTVEILLSGGPILNVNQTFSPPLTITGSPSGLNISAAMPAKAIIAVRGGASAKPISEAVDIGGDSPGPLTMTSAMFQDSPTTPGSVDAGDRMEITFDGPVTVATPDPTGLFIFPVSGDLLAPGSVFIGPTTGQVTLTVELTAGSSFTPDGIFDPVLLSPGDPSGIEIAPGLPAGTIVHAVTGVDITPGTVGLDIGGGLLPSPAPELLGVTFDDANGSRNVDAGDLLRLQFNRTVIRTSTSIMGFGLTVVGDTLGTGATLEQSSVGSLEVQILIGNNPFLTVNGLFNVGQTSAGSPSGFLVLGSNDIEDAATGTPAAPAGPLDMGGAIPPYVVSAQFEDRDNSGFVSIDDHVVVTFNENVLLFPGSLPGDVFQMPHLGDSLGGTATFWGSQTNTPILTVRLGLGAVAIVDGFFDPANPGAGPSGIDLLPGTSLVQEMRGGVGGEPLSPAGVDIAGVTGPKLSRVNYQDLNGTQAVDQGDALYFFFSSVVDINDNVPANVFFPLVAGDNLGTGADFLGGAAPLNTTVAVVILGSGPVLQPNSAFQDWATAPGSASGFDLLPAAPVTATGSGQPSLLRNPLGVDLRGSLPGLQGPGPWRPTGNDMAGARFSHTVTVLQDGKILVIGGGDVNTSLDTIEVFDPSAGATGQGEFSLASTFLAEPRESHTATRVAGPDRILDTADDVVIVIGGFQFLGGPGTSLGSIEIIDPDANNDGITGDYLNLPWPAAGDFTQFNIQGPSGPEPASIYNHEALYLPQANVAIAGLPLEDNLGRQIFTIGGLAFLQGSTVLVNGYEFCVVNVDPNGDENYSDSDVVIYDLLAGGSRLSRYSRVQHSATVITGPDGVVGTQDDQIFVYGGIGVDRDDTGGTGGSPRARNLGSGEIIFGLGTSMLPGYAGVTQNDFYPNTPQTVGGTPGVDPTPRSDHVAVLLSDGSVLIGHGTNQDGNVGFGPGNDLTTAYEIFTPNHLDLAGSLFTFGPRTLVPPTGTVEETLLGPGAVTLPGGGRVLVAGGFDFLNSADPFNPDPTATSEDVDILPGPAAVVFPANDMSTPRAGFPRMRLILIPGIDLMLGTGDDRAVAIGGVMDDVGTPTGSADFFIP